MASGAEGELMLLGPQVTDTIAGDVVEFGVSGQSYWTLVEIAAGGLTYGKD